jgi:glycogen operon protein
MGVDGFRFDLASILTRDLSGAPMASPPVISAIHQEPARLYPFVAGSSE